MRKNVCEKILFLVYGFYHVVFAMDFGFIKFKSVKINSLFKFWLFVQSFIISVFFSRLIDHIDLYVFIWNTIYVLHYTAFAVILTFSKHGNNITDLFVELRKIDVVLNIDCGSNSVWRMVISIFLLTCYRILDTIIFCLLEDVNGYCGATVKGFCITLGYVSFILCLDLVKLTCCFVFYSFLCRLKKISSILDSANSKFLSIQLQYKLIVNLLEKFKNAIILLYMTDLLFTIAEVMGSMFYTIFAMMGKDDKVTMSTLEFTLNLTSVAVNLLMTLAPALCAGALTSQAERIKLILHEKLFEQRDGPEAQDIERFIRYVEARPCRFRMFKVVPLDADLMGQVLNFCVKYLIVIIQFTDKK